MFEEIAREKILLKRIRERCSKTSQPGVSIIASTSKLKYINNIFANYARLDYPNKELIIILNNNKFNIDDYKRQSQDSQDIEIFQLDEKYTLGECLNFGIEHSKYNYVSKMDDDDYYGSYYLTDLMNVFKYTDAQITGKTTCFVYFQNNNSLGIFMPNYENRYVNNLAGGTILFKKEVFEKVKFRNLNIGEDNCFLSDCIIAGLKIFSSDKYNYVYMRNKNLHEHTWQISEQQMLSNYVTKILVTTNSTYFVSV
jgi:cellulose synthase/poly-beta-1,6-N-acetylglucosamine synthase-like glycosyltransferase